MIRTFLIVLALSFASAAAHAADIQSFGRGSWSQLRAAHGGQPTVIHFWGLTCAPCLVEMPEWGKLRTERPEMRLVMVAADPMPQDPARVADMLARADLAKAENWAFSDRFNERLRYEIDPAWAGELPRTMLIDRDGKETVLTGVADLAEVRAWLDVQKTR